MINVNTGMPHQRYFEGAPGTLYMNFLDFSPAPGESWRSPRLLNAKVYVNTAEGWDDGGFYQIERTSPTRWLLRFSGDPVERVVRFPAVLVGRYKTRKDALAAAAAHLRARAIDIQPIESV